MRVLSQSLSIPGSVRGRVIRKPIPQSWIGRPDRRVLRLEHLEHRHLLSVSPSLQEVAAVSSKPYEPLPIVDPFVRDAVTVESMRARAVIRCFVPDELVVALEVPMAKAQAERFVESISWGQRLNRLDVTPMRTLLTTQRGDNTSVSLVRLHVGNQDIFETMAALDQLPDVLWSSPNFMEAGDPREYTPNDPQYSGQYHHPLMRNHLAWDLTLGSPSIIIGVTDDGVSLTHVDLVENIFVNPGEIPNNSLDDDGNGYIDDVNGWDFINGNNNPNPDSASFDHGTHVAGIAAGRTDNGIGIAGTAGRARILPLQFYNGSWNAASINETFRYGTNMGARIITTSYNIDGWVGDPVFTAGMQYMYDNGVLHFNSAGNNNQLNPPRQTFEQTILVANTTSTDTRNSTSNYGIGVDLAAPGTNINSTILNNGYGLKSGTSMAAPNAAGAAGLIWSLNPSWTRDQVAAQLLATADNIDAANPGFAGLLGSGRVNSFRALTENIGAPKVKSLAGLPPNGSAVSPSTLGAIQVAFTQVMDPASVNQTAHYDLRSSGPDGLFDTADDVVFTPTLSKPYRISTNQFDLTFSGPALGVGQYRFSLISGGLRNPFGTPLDGNGDGTGGDNFVSFFDVRMVGLPPAGSLIYQTTFTGAITSAEETDVFTLPLDAGQSLSMVAQATPGLIPRLALRAPGGTLLGQVTGTGNVALLQSLPVQTAGAYSVEISGVSGTIGNYRIQTVLNAALESETYLNQGNNTFATAQSLDSAAVALGSGSARQMGVVGQFSFKDGFESGALSSQWSTFSSNAQGRIRVDGSLGTAAGNFALLMDRSPSGAFSLNEAILTVNLTDLVNPILTFQHAEWGDEEQALPLSFTGSANGDGVAISDNGVQWRRVFNPTNQPTAGQWQLKTVNLATEAAAAGMTLGPNFRIKFQQYDDFPFPTDGRGWDEIRIASGSTADWYQFTLNDGENASISLTSHTSLAETATLELYASNGTTLLATGNVAGNVNRTINRFRDNTSNGTPDTYYIRVAGEADMYSLVVTRNADFDTEPNNSIATAQNISNTSGALGHVTFGSDPDFYGITLTAGQTLRLDASLPGGGPLEFLNSLSAPGGSRLMLELFDPTGTIVASHHETITHTATQSGTYAVRVSATASRGEYYFSYRFVSAIDGDFDDDGDYDCDDINSLSTAIAQSGPVNLFDLNRDGVLSILDQDAWRLEAGMVNLGGDASYPIADANLDGVTDQADFLIWDQHKFSVNSNWCNGNYDANLVVDGADFNLWNEHRSVVLAGTKTSEVSLVPPPAVVERAMEELFPRTKEPDPSRARDATAEIPVAWPTIREGLAAGQGGFSRTRGVKRESAIDRSLATFQSDWLE